MKTLSRLITFAVAAISAVPAFALLEGNGYYRINNVHTGRYAYIVDNTGSINTQTTTIEAGAIELWPGHEATLYDPATVLYFEQHGDRYDIRSQHTGIYQMLGTYVGIREDNPRNPGTYWAFGTKGSMTAYLWDANASLIEPESWMTNVTNNSYPLCRNWYITPIDNNTDNYFGIKPTIITSNGNFAVWYADLNFSFTNSDTHAYYVSLYDNERGLAVYTEIPGNVPAMTPLLIKCPSTNPADNKVNLGVESIPVTGNLLTGVLFNCKKYAHDNRVKNDANTMRVAGVLSDGSLGLVKSTAEYLPRNSFYLKVPANAPAEIRLVTPDEYEEIVNKPIEAESITLSATSLTLTEGESATLTATVLPAETTDPAVTFTTSNASVATVSADGKVTAVAAGNATITAKCGNVSATCAVTVKPLIIEATAVTLSATSLTLTEGESATLTATVSPANTTDPTVTFTTSDASVATVTADGKVTAVAAGNATITAKCGNVSATCAVTVKPLIIEATAVTLDRSSMAMLVGESTGLIATVTPANTTDPTVVFTTSDASVAAVTADGTVTALAVGTAVITATCGNASATCNVIVSPVIIDAEAVTLDCTEIAMLVGDSATLTATVTPDDTTDPTVTFTTSDASVATVSTDGVVTAVGEGTAVITATCGSVSAECNVTVSRIEQTITWTQTFGDLYEGQTIELEATASSGLPVSYTVTEGADIAMLDGNKLTFNAPGTVKVVASQDGDIKYYAAATVEMTFNALSGITDITAGAARVRAIAGALQVSGLNDGDIVEVYTTGGLLLYRGTDSVIRLAPGLVIVKIAGKAVKVIVNR